MTSIDDLLAEAVAREKSVKILLRQDLLGEHERLEAELQAELELDMRENRDPLGPVLAARLLDFEAEIEAARREFRFRAVGKRPWADLLAAHPPTKEQLQKMARLDHNPETLPTAAVAASCIDPVMTVEQVAQLEQVLNFAQFERLWECCLDVNVAGGGGAVPKSLIAGPIARANAELGITAANGVSRGRPSSDE